MATHEPYRSLTPWTGFSPRERKRATPLDRCPAAACRRAKACVSAIDALYCRRTHMTVAEARALARQQGHVAKDPVPRLPKNPTRAQMQAYVLASDMAVARAAEQRQEMTAQWKAGKLDHLYGPYDPRGALMRPPPRVFHED